MFELDICRAWPEIDKLTERERRRSAPTSQRHDGCDSRPMNGLATLRYLALPLHTAPLLLVALFSVLLRLAQELAR